MELSQMLIKTISVSLDAIFKASHTDIRVHGIERVPEGPVLFVINHFTRMETILMPYVIRKNLKRYPISLAHHSFFGGGFGNLIQKFGAVSTKDPERDQVLMRALLTGEYPVIIFPEGQMIKDKKIIERGKFMVYNTGLRRPPHTGAAHIALRSQIYREKIRAFNARGDRDTLMRYKEYFHLEDSDIDAIIEKNTFIVPVNLTYYPIRARDNAINHLVSRFVKNVSPRFEEEIEVEGTMLLDGVDIDINFGAPLAAGDYLAKSRKARRVMADGNIYLSDRELSQKSGLRNIDIRLMNDYMTSIYGMTTVNHDHIFSSILTKSLKGRMSEIEFKDRAFMAIDRLLKTNITNHHTSLLLKQFYLLTDDYHDKYSSFIEAAISDGLVQVKDGIIIRNREKFNLPYRFHAIRKDNIIEVLNNEIEPLRELIGSLNRLTLTPGFVVRRRIRKQFLELDRSLFEQDYAEHYIEGESKPREIGRPVFMGKLFAKGGIVLVHGYMAAPEEMRELGEFLNRNGFRVYLARMRGHGTSPEDLAEMTWKKWYDSVSRGYIIMKNSVKHVFIGGFSTGAGVALLQAASKVMGLEGVISISAPLKLQNIASHLSSAVVAWNTLLKKIHLRAGRMEFMPNNPENPQINYLRNPVHGVLELERLMKFTEESLGDIEVPALVIQGSEDPVVNPVSAKEIFELIGTGRKEYYSVYSTRHGIIRGPESVTVKEKVLHFMQEVIARGGKRGSVD